MPLHIFSPSLAHRLKHSCAFNFQLASRLCTHAELHLPVCVHLHPNKQAHRRSHLHRPSHLVAYTEPPHQGMLMGDTLAPTRMRVHNAVLPTHGCLNISAVRSARIHACGTWAPTPRRRPHWLLSSRVVPTGATVFLLLVLVTASGTLKSPM